MKFYGRLFLMHTKLKNIHDLCLFFSESPRAHVLTKKVFHFLKDYSEILIYEILFLTSVCSCAHVLTRKRFSLRFSFPHRSCHRRTHTLQTRKACQVHPIFHFLTLHTLFFFFHDFDFFITHANTHPSCYEKK